MKPVKVTLTRAQMLIVYDDAKAADLKGKSQIRSGKERKESCLEDQIVGLAGNYALSMYLYNSDKAYRDMRHTQNRFPDKGDGGYDLPRLRFDIKTTMMRYGNRFSKYNLPVRPKERHPGWTYGLALIPKFEVADLANGLNVYMIGWAQESSLPEEPRKTDPLKGAYTLPATVLNPFTPLNYE